MIFFELVFEGFFGDSIVIRRLESCMAIGTRVLGSTKTKWIAECESLEAALEFLYDKHHLRQFATLTFAYKGQSNKDRKKENEQ